MKNLTFEKAMHRLEEIADLLESGTQTLEKSLQLFEEGSELATYCNEQLNKAEQKVQILTKTNDSFELKD
jgi:exodeoxyribonuclease VII small subunit